MAARLITCWNERKHQSRHFGGYGTATITSTERTDFITTTNRQEEEKDEDEACGLEEPPLWSLEELEYAQGIPSFPRAKNAGSLLPAVNRGMWQCPS